MSRWGDDDESRTRQYVDTRHWLVAAYFSMWVGVNVVIAPSSRQKMERWRQRTVLSDELLDAVIAPVPWVNVNHREATWSENYSEVGHRARCEPSPYRRPIARSILPPVGSQRPEWVLSRR